MTMKLCRIVYSTLYVGVRDGSRWHRMETVLLANYDDQNENSPRKCASPIQYHQKRATSISGYQRNVQCPFSPSLQCATPPEMCSTHFDRHRNVQRPSMGCDDMRCGSIIFMSHRVGVLPGSPLAGRPMAPHGSKDLIGGKRGK
jgi:hypothetical protein